MICTCPSCTTRYIVDAQALGARGRNVRCSRCAHTWFETGQTALPAPSMAPAMAAAGSAGMAEGVGGFAGERLDGPASMRRPAAARPAPKRASPMIGWLVFVAVVLALMIGLILGREPIVAAWPPAARLFETVGLRLAPPGEGLDLRGVRSIRDADGHELRVEGTVVNVAAKAVALPAIGINLRDASGQVVRHLQARPFSQTALSIADSLPFSLTIADPGEATNVEVTFERPSP